jgi:hypothetical protein
MSYIILVRGPPDEVYNHQQCPAITYDMPDYLQPDWWCSQSIMTLPITSHQSWLLQSPLPSIMTYPHHSTRSLATHIVLQSLLTNSSINQIVNIIKIFLKVLLSCVVGFNMVESFKILILEHPWEALPSEFFYNTGYIVYKLLYQLTWR